MNNCEVHHITKDTCGKAKSIIMVFIERWTVNEDYTGVINGRCVAHLLIVVIWNDFTWSRDVNG